LAADELLIAVELPIAQGNSVHFFQEFARRKGDYALAGIAAQATIESSVISSLRMAFFGVADRPVMAKAAARLVNVSMTPRLITDAAAAFAEELDPPEDQHASSSMRRHLRRLLAPPGSLEELGDGSRDDLA
jgi:carbon-monoxide dehydrogenase medium subunit